MRIRKPKNNPSPSEVRTCTSTRGTRYKKTHQIPDQYKPFVYLAVAAVVIFSLSVIPELVRFAIREPVSVLGLFFCGIAMYSADKFAAAIRAQIMGESDDE